MNNRLGTAVNVKDVATKKQQLPSHSQPVASVFKTGLGTKVGTAVIKKGAAKGTVQIYDFGGKLGHKGGKSKSVHSCHVTVFLQLVVSLKMSLPSQAGSTHHSGGI